MQSASNQHVNEANNVTNIEELAKAIKSHMNTYDIIVLTCDINDSLKFKKSISFPGITKFHSILYEGKMMTFYRYNGIGTGVERKLKDLVKTDYECLKNHINSAELTIKSNSFDNIKTTNLKISEKKIEQPIICLDCNEVFLSKNELVKHKKSHRLKSMTQIERAQIMFTQSCKGIRLQSYQNETVGSFTTENKSQTYQTRELPLGYALPKPKSTVRFTLEQQTYIINLFNAGMHDKNKRARPCAVAHDILYHFEPDF